MNLYIDIAISLILIFLIFSVVVYVLQELLAINLQYRGKMLWNSLANVFDGLDIPGKRTQLGAGIPNADTPVTQLFFDHAQIQTLQKDAHTLTSYISSSNFALALIDVVAQHAPLPRSGDLFVDFTKGLPVFTARFKTLAGIPRPRPVVDLLNTFAGISANIADLQNSIEKWYNEYMNRVSGWYQSHTVVTIRLIALAVTLAFNLNSIQLIKDIAANSVLRTNLTGIAERVVDHPETVNNFLNKGFKDQIESIGQRYQPMLDAAKDNQAKLDSVQHQVDTAKENAAARYTALNVHAIDSLTKTLSAVSLPIGWGHHTDNDNGIRLKEDPGAVLLHCLLVLLGWLITAGCLSMGAPFWFDLLIQLVNIRRAGVKPGGDKKK